jgi:hypothetical protein
MRERRLRASILKGQDGRDAQPIREGERHEHQEPGHARLSADESWLLPSRPS